MSMMEIHADAVNSVCAAYHEFLLLYKVESFQVYGIVEGKDDPQFYRGFIESHLPQGWTVELIPADGKKNVISSYHEFDWTRFPKARIGFFIDRDLSNFITESIPTDDNVYVTDRYSIENDVVNFGTFRRFFEEVLNVTRLSPDEVQALEDCFNRSSEGFREALAPLMAQIIVWRRQGMRPCLDEFSPVSMFELVGGVSLLKAEFVGVENRMNALSESVQIDAPCLADVSIAEGEFRSGQGVECFVRGKYLMEFLVFLSLELRASLPMILPKRSKIPKLNVTVGKKNAMIYVAPRCRIPTSLAEFLQRVYLQYTATRAA